MALPEHQEEIPPEWARFSQDKLPVTEGEGFGRYFRNPLTRSPAQTHPKYGFFAATVPKSGASIAVPADYEERALYIVEKKLSQRGIASLISIG